MKRYTSDYVFYFFQWPRVNLKLITTFFATGLVFITWNQIDLLLYAINDALVS